MLSNRPATGSSMMRSSVRVRGAALLAAVVTLATTFASGLAQGPSAGGQPDRSERRRAEPCEKAANAEGRAHVLRGQCDPAGGGGGSAKGDFNGDGFGDLAIGVPGEDIVRASETVVRDAGAVHIIYGTADGLSSAGNQLLHQDVSGVSGTPTPEDEFGRTVVAGHFNSDIYSDLAVGVPGETLGGIPKAGAVQVFYGSPSGLTTTGQQFWDYFDLPSDFRLYNPWANTFETPDPEDNFFGYGWGEALVWADFNGDDIGDLAIGVPDLAYETLNLIDSLRGAVVVLYGSATGLTVAGAQGFAGKEFGRDFEVGLGDSLGAGDFNGDGNDDLALGAPRDYLFRFHVLGIESAGSVRVVFGSPSGLGQTTVDLSQQLLGSAEADDRFGWTMATGDFDGDGVDDLAVGAPFEDLINNTQTDAGFVHVFFGQATNFGSRRQNVSQGSAAAAGDRFGLALAAGRFNFDGFHELAVGVPGEDVGSIANAGIVQVFHGSSTGLSSSDFEVWHQNVSGIANTAESGDFFGASLSAWNFGRDEVLLFGTLRIPVLTADLVVGVPNEDVIFNSQDFRRAGAVHVIYGSTSGLTATGDQFFMQANLSGDGPQEDDRFGAAVY